MAEFSTNPTGDGVSVVLLYWIEEELRRRGPPDGASVERTIWELLHAAQLPTALAGRFPTRADDIAFILSDRAVLGSIVEAALERWRGGPGAPVLRIAPRPLRPRQAAALLGDGINLGLIFGAEKVYFQDTVHALHTDESRSRSCGDRRVNVLGVHVRWRTADGVAAKRCLLVEDTGVVKEVRFDTPVPLHIVQTLHLPVRGEIELHRSISDHYERLGVAQLNPYPASQRADDKAHTHRLWSVASPPIPSPKAAPVPRGSSIFDALDAMGPSPFVFVQPNTGTEGRKAARYPTHARGAICQFISEEIWPQDDAIVREERGDLRYREVGSAHPSARGFLRFALRVNVAWNGTGFVAESGFVQVAEHDEHPVASRGRNGSVVSTRQGLGNLWYAQGTGWRRYVPTPEDLACMKDAAVRAACALNADLREADYLKLVGVDLLLEVGSDGRMAPLVLEANPRPAGLAQSWMLDDPSIPGVSCGLLQGIKRAFNYHSAPQLSNGVLTQTLTRAS
jgi:hypothetical protein